MIFHIFLKNVIHHVQAQKHKIEMQQIIIYKKIVPMYKNLEVLISLKH